jgi:metallo-beta-lactamase class B
MYKLSNSWIYKQANFNGKKTSRMKNFILTLVLIVAKGFLYGQAVSERVTINNKLYLIKLTANSWIHVSYLNGYPCNGLILAENNKAFLFDTPPDDSTTQNLVDYIEKTLKLQIAGFITNDWHIDSQGGLGLINRLGIPSYSNELTRQIAKSKGLPFTNHGFNDSLRIAFESKTIECYYLGAAHTMDNILVWIPSEQVLFADCLVKELSQNNLGFTGDGDINAYPETLKRISKKFSNAKYVIPGHGLYGGFELVTHTMSIVNKK